MYDILIKNGTVIDGCGVKGKFRADVGISGGVIASIGNPTNAQAKKAIDATGLYVAPGFIDALNHSDTYLTLLTNPLQESLVSQGITTIIGGNCGYSLAPLVSGNVMDSQQRWGNPSQINIDWLRMSEFLARMGEKKMNVNFGTLTGYNTIVKGLVHDEYEEMNSQQHEIAGFLADQSQFEGSLGISLGLAYLHHDQSFEDDLERVFSLAKKHRKIVTAHLRDESDRFLDSLRSVIRQALREEVSLHLSHLKVIGKKHWPNFREAIVLIEQAASRGLRISFDMFPYASSGLELYLLLPHWAKQGGQDAVMKRLHNTAERKQILKDLAAQHIEYDKITVASLAPDPVFVGKTIADIARDLAISGEEAIVEMLLGSRLSVIAFAHVLDEHNVQMAVAHPLSLVASSGAGYSIERAKGSSDLPHPRSFGAFPRFFKKYVREKPLLSWEHAVAKVTSIPARVFRLPRRGLLLDNYPADVVVFDPERISDVATFENPYQYSKGVLSVLANGVLTFHEGRVLSHVPGTVLYAQ